MELKGYQTQPQSFTSKLSISQCLICLQNHVGTCILLWPSSFYSIGMHLTCTTSSMWLNIMGYIWNDDIINLISCSYGKRSSTFKVIACVLFMLLHFIWSLGLYYILFILFQDGHLKVFSSVEESEQFGEMTWFLWPMTTMRFVSVCMSSFILKKLIL